MRNRKMKPNHMKIPKKWKDKFTSKIRRSNSCEGVESVESSVSY